MRVLNFLIVTILLAGPAAAADLATLQEQALENREVVRRHLADLERSGRQKGLARSAFYPAIDLSYTATWLDEPKTFEADETSVATGMVTMNVFSGFRDLYSVRSAERLRQAEEYKLQGVRQDIKLAVALRYLEIHNRQANLEVAEASFSTLNKLHEDAVNRFQVGMIKKSEMLSFKVDLDNAVIFREKARAQLEQSIILLQREIGTACRVEELAFGEFDQIPELEGHAVYEEEMLERRSELKFLEGLAAAAALKVNIERSSYYPRVDLAGAYSQFENDLLAPNPDDEVRTQVIVSMNLFDGFGKNSRIASAKLEARGLEYDLAEARRDFKARLRNLFLDFKVNVDNVRVAAGSIVQAEENLRVTRLAYEEGVSAESELLDAIASLSRARYAYVAAKSEAFANYFRITRSVERL